MLEFIVSPAAFFAIILVFAMGAGGALLLGKNDRPADIWGNYFAILGSVSGLVFSSAVLLTGVSSAFSIPSSFPLLYLSFRVDYLSAFFMLLISVIALFCSIYALGYVRHFYKKYNVGVLGFFYNIFIASMILVVTAHHVLFFLIVWEIMSLASYFLVIFERHEEKNIKAGTLYFIMAHIGTAFIIFSFLLLYKATGSFDFDTIRSGIAGIPPTLKNAVFVSALIGFGAKAGIIPFHIWLPSAHPAAPSHVSALMSGVMIKTGIYMLVRICWDILPGIPLWWGLVLLVIGSVSSLLGVLYALSEHDLKKLLAYHSIENIGIIFLGLGSSLAFLSAGMKVLAVFGLVAALYHTMNHATFKALLFLGAGSVIAETNTRNIEKYGGLIKVMPQTAVFFLAGSMAISALPPLNGFFSEWMTFQSLFFGVTAFGPTAKMVFILSIGALAFTGGLAAACFVKAFGMTFLARPRSREAKHAKEPALPLRLAMAALALLTLVLGFFAGPVSHAFSVLVTRLANVQHWEVSASAAESFGFISVSTGLADISMPAIVTVIVLVTAAFAAAFAFFTRERKIKTGITWDCGADLSPRMEITATGFSRSIITIFRGVLKPTGQTEIEYHDARLRYFPKSGTVTMGLQDVYASYFYKPLQELTVRLADEIKKIQGGNINVYILYIFITLTGLLLMLVI
ncbi:MAG: hydrogenase 4 subunit B [Syntrophales bacterium]|nr:hydrogenase 4 subunit B [Syntrophales bacterium]